MKLVLSATILLGLFFAGCSSKQDITINNNAKNNIMEDKQIEENIIEKSHKINISTQTVYFDFDQYSIKKDMRDRVLENTSNIKKFLDNYQTFMISIDGHCDNRGTDEYNFALGLKRAQVIKKQLVQAGVNEKNIVTKSLGESAPVCMENTKECWSQNRRVTYTVK